MRFYSIRVILGICSLLSACSGGFNLKEQQKFTFDELAELRITNPEANATFSGVFEISGICVDEVDEVLISGDIHEPHSVSCLEGSFSADIKLDSGEDGTRNVVATQKDETGGEISDSEIYILDTTAPTLSINSSGLGQSPSANASGKSVTITSPNNDWSYVKTSLAYSSQINTTTCEGVDFAQQEATPVSNNVFNYSFDANLGDGAYRVCAIGRDQAGNWQEATTSSAILVIKQEAPSINFFDGNEATIGGCDDQFVQPSFVVQDWYFDSEQDIDIEISGNIEFGVQGTYVKNYVAQDPLGNESENPFLVTVFANALNSPSDFDLMRTDTSGNFELCQDIDFSGIDNFVPIEGPDSDQIPGDVDRFEGILEGNDFEISNLTINRPDEQRVALFRGLDAPGIIRNFSINSVEIQGERYVGAIMGSNFGAQIENLSIDSVHVSGVSSVGSLGGFNHRPELSSPEVSRIQNVEILNSSVELVNGFGGPKQAGGLVGSLQSLVENVSVEADITVTSCGGYGYSSRLGGISGWVFQTAEVVDSSFQGSITTSPDCAMHNVGGLIGQGRDILVERSYTEGEIVGENGLGGLVGLCSASTIPCEGISIHDSYSHMDVIGTDLVSGAVAQVNDSAFLVLENVYAAGELQGNSANGLIGTVEEPENSELQVISSYWDVEASGTVESYGDLGLGLGTEAMMQPSTFVNWDFEQVWGIVPNETYPFLIP